MSNEPILQRITGANNNRDARFRFAVLVTGALVILAMTYGSGMRQQKKKLGEVEEISKTYKRDLRLTQLELLVRDAHIQLLEAQRDLSRAEASLAASDTARAQELMKNAAARLETAQRSEATTLPDTARIRAILTTPPTPKSLAAARYALDKLLEDIAPKPDFLSPVTVAPPTLNDVPQTQSVPGGEVLQRE